MRKGLRTEEWAWRPIGWNIEPAVIALVFGLQHILDRRVPAAAALAAFKGAFVGVRQACRQITEFGPSVCRRIVIGRESGRPTGHSKHYEQLTQKAR